MPARLARAPRGVPGGGVSRSRGPGWEGRRVGAGARVRGRTCRGCGDGARTARGLRAAAGVRAGSLCAWQGGWVWL